MKRALRALERNLTDLKSIRNRINVVGNYEIRPRKLEKASSLIEEQINELAGYIKEKEENGEEV